MNVGRAPGYYASDEGPDRGTCIKCPANTTVAQSTRTRDSKCLSNISTLACECTSFHCDSTFVSIGRNAEMTIARCGPLLDVLLLAFLPENAELGRALLLCIPLVACALGIAWLLQRIHFGALPLSSVLRIALACVHAALGGLCAILRRGRPNVSRAAARGQRQSSAPGKQLDNEMELVSIRAMGERNGGGTGPRDQQWQRREAEVPKRGEEEENERRQRDVPSQVADVDLDSDAGRMVGKAGACEAAGEVSPGVTAVSSAELRERLVLSGGAHKFESLADEQTSEEDKHKAQMHVQRIHLDGKNSTMKPWKLPPLTATLLKVFDQGEYLKLSADLEKATTWASWELLGYTFLSIVPPAVEHYAMWRRRAHYHRAIAVVSGIGSERSERLWRSLATRVGQEQRLELNCCPLLQFAWLDSFYGGAQPSEVVPKARSTAQLVSRALSSLGGGLQQRKRAKASLVDHASDGLYADSTPASPKSVKVTAIADDVGWADFDRLLREGGDRGRTGTGAAVDPMRLELQVDRPHPLDAEGVADRSSRTSGTPCVCIPLCGMFTLFTPAFIHCGDFAAHAALSEALGASTADVVAILNVSLAAVDRSSCRWAARFATVLRLIQQINHQLTLAHAAANDTPLTSAELTPPSMDHDEYAAPGGDCTSCGEAVSMAAVYGNAGADGAARDPSQLSLSKKHVQGEEQDLAVRPPMLFALLHRASEAVGQDEHCHVVIAIGEGEPRGWQLPRQYTHLTPTRLSNFDMGQEWVTPAPFTSTRDAQPMNWSGSRLVAVIYDALRAVVCGGFVRPHPYRAWAAWLLLAMQLVDASFTILLYGTFCSASEGIGGCTASLLLPPLVGLISPLYGISATTNVLVGIGSDLMRLLLPPKWFALKDSRAWRGAPTLHLRRAALWNAFSLINTTVGLVASLITDGLFTSKLPWLLPLCALITKLLLAQAIQTLAAAAGLAGDAHTLLVRLTPPTKGSRVARAVRSTARARVANVAANAHADAADAAERPALRTVARHAAPGSSKATNLLSGITLDSSCSAKHVSMAGTSYGNDAGESGATPTSSLEHRKGATTASQKLALLEPGRPTSERL